ncbi:MAG TPA: hypothetical protein VFK13_11610 [Gemmatimonadaceae bacterium]|nr:hypothetical protein [Gemmatimonadaceae bacterium]
MARRKGRQKGAQQHAEGAHGPKTHDALLRTLHARAPRDPATGAPADTGERNVREVRDLGPGEGERGLHEREGAHRLFEHRDQHDEAEANSEKRRLSKDIDEHGHDRSRHQVPGGAATHPELPET